jgi:spore maturation protein CgeB
LARDDVARRRARQDVAMDAGEDRPDMKVLLLSLRGEGKFGLIRYFERGLRALDHDVSVYAHVNTAIPIPLGPIENTRLEAVARRVVRRGQNELFERQESKLVDAVMERVRAFKPDVVVMAKGSGVELAVVRALAEAKVRIFNFYPDPLPLDDDDFIRTIPLFSCVFTYSKFQVPSWYWFGAQRVHYLPFASDPELHQPKAPPSGREDYFRSPVGYLATWHPYAEDWPAHLVRFGLKIWGNQWHMLSPTHPARAAWQGEGKGSYDELAVVCGASDVVFNMVRAWNGSSHSMKTFEIPACGGFMLGNRTDEQRTFFEEDVAAAYFSTIEEMVDKVDFYLRNESARRKIAAKGLEVAQQHRYEHRMRELVDLARA